MKQSNSAPPANFNPWRIAGGAFLLLIVGFGIFYFVQPATPPSPQTPPLPVDPQSTAVESIAPATGEAERDLKPRLENAATSNVAPAIPPNGSMPPPRRGAAEAPFAPGGGDLPPLDDPIPAPPTVDSRPQPIAPEKPTAAPPVAKPTPPAATEPKQETTAPSPGQL